MWLECGSEYSQFFFRSDFSPLKVGQTMRHQKIFSAPLSAGDGAGYWIGFLSPSPVAFDRDKQAFHLAYLLQSKGGTLETTSDLFSTRVLRASSGCFSRGMPVGVADH
jgi:hypothetical protein